MGNPLGYWEPRAAIYLNQAILFRHGSAAYDPTLRLQEDGAFDAEEKATCIAKIGAFLTTLPAAPLVVIKDPRMTALSGMWFEAARLAGFDIAAVIMVRHPQEVHESRRLPSSMARRRRGFGGGRGKRLGREYSPELASALWLKANLLSERDTRGMPRVFVEYANLLDDWRREITRISTALAIDLNTRDEGAIEEFLTPGQRRQPHCGPVTEPFGTDWMSTVYETLRAAARDEPWDGSALDRVFEAYRASEHGIRTAVEDFHDAFNSVGGRLLRPPFPKLILEGLAMAHRRRGTWA